MPLHGNSVYAATALEAAGEQGRYWDMLDALFHYQPRWGSHHHPKPELIPVYADEIGLDMGAFETAIPYVANPSQLDDDNDGVGNLCDNCSANFNPNQIDSDGNGTGDVCEP